MGLTSPILAKCGQERACCSRERVRQTLQSACEEQYHVLLKPRFIMDQYDQRPDPNITLVRTIRPLSPHLTVHKPQPTSVLFNIYTVYISTSQYLYCIEGDLPARYLQGRSPKWTFEAFLKRQHLFRAILRVSVPFSIPSEGDAERILRALVTSLVSEALSLRLPFSIPFPSPFPFASQ